MCMSHFVSFTLNLKFIQNRMSVRQNNRWNEVTLCKVCALSDMSVYQSVSCTINLPLYIFCVLSIKTTCHVIYIYSEPCTHACLYPTWWSIQSPNVSRRSRGLSEVWLQDHSMPKQANTLIGYISRQIPGSGPNGCFENWQQNCLLWFCQCTRGQWPRQGVVIRTLVNLMCQPHTTWP